MQAYFLAAVDAFTPSIAVLMAGLVNLVGDLTLCLGFGFGIAGAAWATVAAQVISPSSSQCQVASLLHFAVMGQAMLGCRNNKYPLHQSQTCQRRPHFESAEMHCNAACLDACIRGIMHTT